MDNTVTERLDQLIGKTISFDGKNIVVQKYKFIAGNINIVTDARTFQFYPKEIETNFFDLIKENKTEDTFTLQPQINDESLLAVIPQENETIKKMLLDALQNVKKDPAFIKQAKSICDITNTLINVQKMEFEIMKMRQDLN